MNGFELIRDFRANVPTPAAPVRAAALSQLTWRMEARARTPLGRRRVLIGVALLIALLAVGTAFAFGDRIFDLVRGKPAPTAIRKGPLSTYEPGRLPRDMPKQMQAIARGYEVIGEWRGVLGFRTSLGGAITVWKARARNGSLCFAYVWTNDDLTRLEPGGGGGICDHPGWRSGDPWPNDRNGRFLTKQFPLGRPTLAVQISGLSHARGEIQLLLGRAAIDVAQVEIRFRNGARRRIRVYDTFLAAEIPRGSVVTRLVPLDARGIAIPCNYKRYCVSPGVPR